MSRPLRPASERYSVCCSVPDSGSFCSQDGRHFSTNSADDEDTPIFSISKSSVDVLSASPHLRDAAFARADRPRCASSSEQHCGVNTFQSPTLNASPLTKHNLETHNRPHWLSNMQRWSSCSAQSRSSTPDTVIFRGSPPDKAADSSKMASPPPSPPSPPSPLPETPSPELTSPELTSPELTPAVPLSHAQVSQLNQDDVSLNSPQFSPLRAKYLSPLPARELLCFAFPSPVSSSVSLEKFAAEDPLYAVRNSEANADDLFPEELPGSLELSFENQDPPFPNVVTVRPTLVPSFSDPYLGACCRCCDRFGRKAVELIDRAGSKPCEETGTRRAELVDVAVQTDSPCASWWSLKRNVSNLGSPSLLGSPPGSQLNLRSPVGSHFNLLSPSSSMFHICSDDEDSRVERDISCETSSNTDSITERRSCLKNRDKTLELGRRSSMKQVQWDEDGMTWEVHGAALDPEELNMAIQKHLELKSEEEDEQKPLRKSTKKNRAPKPPTQTRLSAPKNPTQPTLSAPKNPTQLKLTVLTDDGKGTERTEGTEGTEGDRTEGDRTEGDRTDRTEGDRTGRDEEAEELPTRRTSLTPGPLQRKRRTFRRPGWCGGSRKHQD